MSSKLERELKGLHGEAYFDLLHRTLYATDASAYSQMPAGVVYVRDVDDVARVLRSARSYGMGVIPRAAGTSLAGQVVGAGLVVDVSRYMRKVGQVDVSTRTVWVEPGVVLDELNAGLRSEGLFFSPETSTSNRCCIGGMVGNNSCGSHSVVYGSTRDHLVEARVLLADGSRAHFRRLDETQARRMAHEDSLQGRIYKHIINVFDYGGMDELLAHNGPDSLLRRRNTGYALDALWQEWSKGMGINLCTLLAGSEGTLAFLLEAKLHLDPLPPTEKLVVCAHCATLQESFRANLVALSHSPRAVELIDRTILELSRDNLAQRENRFFIQGDPAAVLVVELAAETHAEVKIAAEALIAEFTAQKLGYAYPILEGDDISRIWSLRKAGLGLLSTMPGDSKPVSLIEDTSVLPERLEEYIADVQAMLEEHGLESVYHAHIAEGELHIRPVLNLKNEADRAKFRSVAQLTAKLVRKYRGSLSGEHGDGRLRGEFIRDALGENLYEQFVALKRVFDPEGILNPQKIVDTPPMDSALRYSHSPEPVGTFFDYAREQGFVRAVEQCNGAGECRKNAIWGGVMCPTYQAIGDERYSTRGRANVLRVALHGSLDTRFDDINALQVLGECLSCKGCKSECPSSVDMARYKAEYLQHYYDRHGVPFRTYLIARMADAYRIAMRVYPLYNAMVRLPGASHILRKIIGFSKHRPLPTLGRYTLRAWTHRNLRGDSRKDKRNVFLFVDEFTNFLDVELGVIFVQLLSRLGYAVRVPKHGESGRAALSKGLLRRAKDLARRNVRDLCEELRDGGPLVGIEPSCILAFRDEYPALLRGQEQGMARKLVSRALLYDEFLMGEVESGRIDPSQFSATGKVLLHGHCHQKALGSVDKSADLLRFCGYEVEVLPTGCCGMAGAYGYESAHYELSMRIGEQVLFPAVRGRGEGVLISAPGTSCRQQILDGTGVRAYHPIELVAYALKSKV